MRTVLSLYVHNVPKQTIRTTIGKLYPQQEFKEEKSLIKKTLSKFKEKDVKEIDNKITKAGKLMEDNQKCCDFEVFKLQKHYYEIVSKLDEIKKNIETKLRNNLLRKNEELREKKLGLQKKSKRVMHLVEFLEKKS